MAPYQPAVATAAPVAPQRTLLQRPSDIFFYTSQLPQLCGLLLPPICSSYIYISLGENFIFESLFRFSRVWCVIFPRSVIHISPCKISGKSTLIPVMKQWLQSRNRNLKNRRRNNQT